MASINKDYSYMEFPLSIARQGGFPLDKYSVFYSLKEAQEYAKNNPLSYPTQIIGVIEESAGTERIYKIKTDGSLEEIASSESSKVQWGSIE